MADDTPSPRRRLGMRLNQRLQASMRGPRQVLRSVLGSNEALSDLYYGVLERAFSREHRAVLAGIHAHEQLERDQAANRFLLRRDIHRIEKGLLMRPRRPLFALGYIEEAVDVYERCLTGTCEDSDEEELRWAHDVLAEYFDVSDADPLVDRLEARFRELPSVGVAGCGAPCRPYLRDLDAPRPVEYEDFYKLAKRRRSVRWFLPEPVPRELLDKAILAAIEAPSACNRQPFQFRVFDDPALVQQVAAVPMGTRGYAHNIPVVVVLVGQLRAFFDPRDRHLIYIDGSLAAMGFMLALETLGLSSCAINWPDIADKERRLAELLDLAPDQRPVMLMAVGYPDPTGAVASSQKLGLDVLRSYNT